MVVHLVTPSINIDGSGRTIEWIDGDAPDARWYRWLWYINILLSKMVASLCSCIKNILQLRGRYAPPIFSTFSSGGAKVRGQYGNPELEAPMVHQVHVVIMATNQSKSSGLNNSSFGWIGGGQFSNANIDKTGARNRTTFGQGTGVYHAYFSVRNFNYYGLVRGNGNHTNISSHSYYVGWQATSYPSGSNNLW